MTTRLFKLLIVCLLPMGHPIWAEDTHVTVRVIARGAQYVGDLVDGARITLVDVRSDKVLAQGITTGDAGDSKRVMTVARKRDEPLAVEGDAAFSTTLDLSEPTLIKVMALGPLQRLESATQVTATQWVMPGKHLNGGDGWVLEMAGFIVAAKTAQHTIDLSTARKGVMIEAEVMMMCGCPVKPDFYWDANQYEVGLRVHRGQREIASLALAYAGVASEFSQQLVLDQPGFYRIDVYAYDEKTGNTGIDTLELSVLDDN